MQRPGIINERLVGLFLLGVVLFTPPFLTVFDVDAAISGVPLLYLYLFGAWALLIALMALVVEGQSGEIDSAPQSDNPTSVGPLRGQ